MNNLNNDPDADDICIHCGHAIYFDVGFRVKCPNCGKNYKGEVKKTDFKKSSQEKHR